MKANSTKRKIFDAVDLLTEDTSSQMPVKTMKGRVTMLDIDSIKPFHNHPFHLYEGDRLDDMVESIRGHGILNPVIVRKIDDGYEMLSGHNRQKAAKIAGLKKIPAIIKYDLPDTDAYVYVIETNLMQRSFSDLEISEKAAVLKERYDSRDEEKEEEAAGQEVLDEEVFDAYLKDLEDATYRLAKEEMSDILTKLQGYSYHGKSLEKPLEQVKKKVEMLDLMSALEVVYRLRDRLRKQ